MALDPRRWATVQQLFHEAVGLPPDGRAAFLDEACAGDDELRRSVQVLLDEDARTGPLDRDVAHLAGEIMDGSVPSVRTIGPYRVVRVLGHGGMGVVYLAERDDIGARVAIKVLRDASLSPQRRERFHSEQRTLAQLGHPAIARLFHADALPDGTPYFVMEYVEGLPLSAYCRAHATGLEARLRLFRAICEAVDFAHRQAVIHRDLKPSNIMIEGDGEPKLLDFGIAKQIESVEGSTAATRTGLRLMTPAYAAPEQVAGTALGVYTDVYALGVILYELLAGALPYDLSERTPGQVEAAILDEEPPPPSERAPGGTAAGEHDDPHAPYANGPGPVDGSIGRAAWADLDVLCRAAMHKDPARRYSSVAALVEDVDHFLAGEPLRARPDSRAYRAGKFVKRNARALATAAGVVVLLAASAAYYTVSIAEARDRALAEAARTERIQSFVLRLLSGQDEVAGPADSLRLVTVLDRGAQEADALDADPLQQADLFLTLGQIDAQLGRFERADSLLALAEQRRRAAHGGAHPEVGEVERARGLVALQRGAYPEAADALTDLLERQRASDAAELEVARTRAALGRALDALDRRDEAVSMLNAAADAFARESGRARELELSEALAALGNAYLNADDLEMADSLNRRALALDSRLHGPRHPTVAASLINLGFIEFRRGRYAEATPLYRQAVDIFEGHYGGDHYETASALRLLGQGLIYQGRIDEARGPLERALTVQERVLGPTHPRLANTLGDLAYIEADDGNVGRAVALYERVRDIYREAHGERHAFVAVTVSNLGNVYLEAGDHERAEPLFRDALERFIEARSADHLDTGIARIKLGRALFRQGRLAEAEAELRKGYEVVRAVSDPTVSWLRAARGDLAQIYDATDRPDDARLLREEQARTDSLATAAAR